MNWSEKVKKLMVDNDINQKQLSQMSGISESSLSRYLHNGKRPRIDIVVNIAKALHVGTEYLLEEEDKVGSPFESIATAIARKGHMLSAEEKNRLIFLILGKESHV